MDYHPFVSMFKLLQIWPVGTLSRGLLCIFDRALSFWWELSSFLRNKIFLLCPSFTFSAQSWNQSFLQRSLVPFSCEWYLDTKTLVPDVLTANWSVIDFMYFSLKKKFFLFVYLFGCTGSSFCHVGSLVAACKLLFAAGSSSLTKSQTGAPCIGSTET